MATKPEVSKSRPGVAAIEEIGPPLVLDRTLDMKSARALKARLSAAMSANGNCGIDATAVERISTGCLQVLAAFAVSMALDGRTVNWIRPSNAFREAVTDLDLAALLLNTNQEA